jgi:hypothetical protein
MKALAGQFPSIAPLFASTKATKRKERIDEIIPPAVLLANAKLPF